MTALCVLSYLVLRRITSWFFFVAEENITMSAGNSLYPKIYLQPINGVRSVLGAFGFWILTWFEYGTSIELAITCCVGLDWYSIFVAGYPHVDVISGPIIYGLLAVTKVISFGWTLTFRGLLGANGISIIFWLNFVFINSIIVRLVPCYGWTNIVASGTIIFVILCCKGGFRITATVTVQDDPW